MSAGGGELLLIIEQNKWKNSYVIQGVHVLISSNLVFSLLTVKSVMINS